MSSCELAVEFYRGKRLPYYMDLHPTFKVESGDVADSKRPAVSPFAFDYVNLAEKVGYFTLVELVRALLQFFSRVSVALGFLNGVLRPLRTGHAHTPR